MSKTKKTCFVIMGFGKKSDPSTGKTLDLDKTYKNIIRPAVIKSGYQCIRADEIQGSGLIDRSMYALLMKAELVIADISTYNPNAIYELGIRHAVRPYATIVIKEKEGKIPFDLDHTRTFPYSHLGEDIGADEAERCQNALSDLINHISIDTIIDSPLYEHIQNISPPELPDNEYKRILGDLAERGEHIFAIVETATENMRQSQFAEAACLWKKASALVPSEPYFIQQHALSHYKAKLPSETTALIDALSIMEPLDPDGLTNDPETLGITGAIYKRLWKINNDIEMLNRAIGYYGKGFKIRGDYYTGENYAICLDMKASIEKDSNEKIYFLVEAKKARQEIIKSLELIVQDKEESKRPDIKWIFATLSNCYYALKDSQKSEIYEQLFGGCSPDDWEKETFLQNKNNVDSLKIKDSIDG